MNKWYTRKGCNTYKRVICSTSLYLVIVISTQLDRIRLFYSSYTTLNAYLYVIYIYIIWNYCGCDALVVLQSAL